MRTLYLAGLLLWISCFLQEVAAHIRDKYCGLNNCYELMNVTRDATTQDIKKSHRQLALKYHPDKSKEPDAEEKFKMINHAYSILTDTALRASYDELLDNPDEAEVYAYYRYYQAKYTPQSDPRLVVGGALIFFSLFQYFNKKRMYENAVKYIERTPRFKAILDQKVADERTKNPSSKRSREEIAEELKKSVKIHGGYAPPKLRDLILFQLVFLPFKIGHFFYFHTRWLVLFTLMKKPYGEPEKDHITRKRLGMKKEHWDSSTEEEIEQWRQLELWDDLKYNKYVKEMQEVQRQKMAESNRYKQFKRFKKNN